MKFQALTVASVIAAIMATSAAFAANSNEASMKSNVQANGKVMTQADRDTGREGDVVDDVQDGLTTADSKMRNAADEIRLIASGDADKDPVTTTTVRRSATADAMIGEDIVNQQGKKVATIKDIVVDQNGKPSSVIVSDGGLLGIGDKLAAFDYSRVQTQQKDGNVVMNLSEDMIKDASKFSYDADDAPDAKVMPAGSASVDKILDGHILDANGDKIGAIDNVAFSGANTQLIVKFNDTFGLGGDLAAVNMRSLERVENDGEVNFRMSANQATKFKNYKKAVE